MKYNQELPKEVEKQLDAYIDRIKAIKWFQPQAKIKKADIEKHVQMACEAFGIKAEVEYKTLKTASDLDAAWDAAYDAAWDAALDAALDAAWDAASNAARYAVRDAARGAVRDAARGAVRDAARGAVDVLALNVNDYKKKYPNGNFVLLIPLWEAGLYPCGVIDSKFVIYVPPLSQGFPEIS